MNPKRHRELRHTVASSIGGCPSGKLGHKTKKGAKRRAGKTGHAYHCARCGLWHRTSTDRRMP